MKLSFLLVLILSPFIIIMSGCTVFPGANVPTPWPTNYLSTAIVLTMDAISPTILPTNSLDIQNHTPQPLEKTPIIETEINNHASSNTPTLIATRSPSATATPIYPQAAIQIVSPGNLSKVISPFTIEAYAQPGADNRVFIELIGEKGQIIASDTRKYQNLSRLWAPVSFELSFHIDQAAEFSRLQIRTEDQYHRTISISPIHLILQSNGINKIFPNTFFFERCIINSTRINRGDNGNALNIYGEFMPFNDQPIQFKLITETGQVINAQSIQLQPILNELFIPFRIEIPYQVKIKTPIRLTISQNDPRIPGDLYVFSQLLVIYP